MLALRAEDFDRTRREVRVERTLAVVVERSGWTVVGGERSDHASFRTALVVASDRARP